ncbi:hypothetical protein Patl1_15286 [Pistacia atlantica]|uniref:Uncharacterized protein n=1 Tax=Pistacia atlantica TaxID=434234 RepID=A0ACC1B806_9ROSI|nr:hypothetical protein Patl1_15286 [Pistacia atlantica]
MHRIHIPSGDPVDDINGRVMKFIIEKNHEVDTWRVPKTLIKYPSPDLSSALQTRYIAMYEYTSDIDEPTHLYINGKSYEQPATETPKVGTSELVNLEEFKTCMTKLNDAIMCHISKYASGKKMEVLAHEKGWKNVYKIIPGYVTKILVRFSYIHSNASYRSMQLQSQILDHEDNAMMRPLKFIK